MVGDTCHGELRPYRLEVLEHPTKDHTTQLVFSHRVVQGLASQSYGINTAALAGCPPAVVARATELLGILTRSQEDQQVLVETDTNHQRVQRARAVLDELKARDDDTIRLNVWKELWHILNE